MQYVVALVLLLGTLVGVPARAQAAPGQLSTSGRYRMWLEPLGGEPAPHTWQSYRLRLARVDGSPLALSGLVVDGGMPAHGHGLPTTPRVRRGAQTGELIVDGVRFNMAGKWQLQVRLADAQGVDDAVFPFELGRSSQSGNDAAGWSAQERASLRSLAIDALGQVPADPTNAVADDARAIALGHRLFFDAELSGNGKVSCASCHAPSKLFSDGRARSAGAAEGRRNTPSLVSVGYARWFFWDGRSDSLWAQALGPLEAAAEMDGSRVDVLRHLSADAEYRAAYVALFGPMPDLRGLPKRARPLGNERERAHWEAIAAERRAAINRAFTNIGKALAAYERQLKPGRSRFDRYVSALEAGDAGAASFLTDIERAGLRTFISDDAQCLRCHNGPLFTNGGFHNIGTILAEGEDTPDFGRSMGLAAIVSSEFNCAGVYSDDASHNCPELTFLNQHDHDAVLDGAYKVPSLRNVAQTAPYMHDGRFATLLDVMRHYRSPGDERLVTEFRPLIDMPGSRLMALAAFLEALSAPLDTPAALLSPPRVSRRVAVRRKQ